MHSKFAVHALIAFAVAALAGTAFAQEARDLSAYDGRPRVQAIRLADDEAITVDGKLEEPIWQRTLPARDFVQQDPNLGQPSTERTEVRIAFSRNNLYLGVICFDSEPDKLMGNTMLRDAALASGDRFQWTFDPYLDGRSGYFFEMNPSGSMGDSLLGGGGGGNFGNAARAWDGIWYAKVNQSDIGWTIEIEIPFRTLNFDPNAPAWGFNIQRTIRRKNEETLWTGWARNQGLRRMTNAGLIEGISDVSQGIGLNVQPYMAGSYKNYGCSSSGSCTKVDAGVDFVYSVTPQLKANFTINTDFAETEVDQRRVNLTRFPLFFPERRNFFLEGTTFFDFSREFGNAIVPFFSRRIGLVNGQPQRIDYGAKVTGQVGAHDIGLIHVRTAASDRLIGEDFTILRAKRRFFQQSYFGMLYTRRAERDTSNPDRYTLGADFALGTSRFRGSQNLEVSGYYLWNTRTVEAKRAVYGFRVDYPNDLWDARISVREIQPGYDPAVGFVERKNVRAYLPGVTFTPRPKNNRVIRSFSFEASGDVYTDLQNHLVTREWDLRVFEVQLQSGDNFQVNVKPTYERLERNFEISRGVILPAGNAYDFTRYSAQLQTSNRRVISINTTYENGTFYSGHRRSFIADLGLRPKVGVLINLNNEWNRVELPEGKFSTSLLRLTGNTQFNPWISIVNNLQYDSVSRVLGWQFRFRWIVRPGNDIYFVYTHNWLSDLAGHRSTLDRSAASKVVYTHRF
jgi:Domain of unknown function (DUF5916)